MATYRKLYNIAFQILTECGSEKDYNRSVKNIQAMKKMKTDAFNEAELDYYISIEKYR